MTIDGAERRRARCRRDLVYVMTGFAPNTELLRRAACRSTGDGHSRARSRRRSRRRCPALFIAGVVVAGYDANKVFIENGRYHGDKIVARLLGQRGPGGAAS